MPQSPERRGSRISGFYRWPLARRRDELLARVGLDANDLAVLDGGGLDVASADEIVENVVGLYALPLGLGLNFRVNGRDHIVPMAVEEPSVIAAASNAARMVREGGGFFVDSDPPIMIAQVELCGVADRALATLRIQARSAEFLALAAQALPRLVERGGGPRTLEVRTVDATPGSGRPCDRLVVHVAVDVCDAMGANMVNTVAETLAGPLAELAGGKAGLRILTNLADRRLVRVRARVPLSALSTDGFEGAAVRDGIVAASQFADDDPYRAATHNKGVMNGVDAVVMASGNDWRGVEAGAHAYAAADGRYRPLARWAVATTADGPVGPDGPDLVGSLVMPMALGTVGGTLRAHAGARLAQRILGVGSATELGAIAGAVGLASNLAALRALATDGIQRGHMALHARSVALAERSKST